MRRNLVLAIAVVAAVTPVVPAAASPSTVQWAACPADAAKPGLECATLQVPLDHRDPQGQQIDIAISRLASRKPAERRGIMLTNPGGPSPGLSFPAELAGPDFGLPESVLDSYDVIGFDLRGIGHSTPVTCDLTPEQQTYGNVPPYARDAADVAKRAEVTKAIAAQCAASKTGRLQPHISTANIARDMDRIREALGEKKISYLGYSYGTYLGAVYATLFPQRSDRMVLDSNLGPAGWDVTADRRYGEGFQDRFPDFARYAAAKNDQFGLGGTPEQVTAKYFELAGRLDREPAQGIDGAQFRLLTFGLMYRDAALPLLARYWHLLDTNQPLPPDGAQPPGAENWMSNRYYVICNDSRWPRAVSAYQRNVAADRIRYPMFGAAGANIQPCAFTPDPIEPPVRVDGRGAGSVLMAQNLRDPATPLSGAAHLRWAFGDRARMITVDHGGHGAYLIDKNQCLDGAVTTFLITGERPAQDLACAGSVPVVEQQRTDGLRAPVADLFQLGGV
ncbi:alpha/beta hydrolase [Pseudonocardiaceae bacterium YIM PH 21723]|nr:alpha/beta hydrolase [Pseudonocardiaceae bacterium YIM PH 21723]